MVRRLLLVLGTIAAVVGVAGTAWASWSSSGFGTGAASTATLMPPTAVTVAADSSGTVHLAWTAGAGTPATSSYDVVRTSEATGSSAPACGTSATATITSTSCDDRSVADGSYRYAVTGVYHSWTATSTAASVRVSTPHQLTFTVQPSGTAAGSPISPALTVAVDDSLGNQVPVAGVAVTIAIGTNPGGGTLSGTATAGTNSSGVATFSALSIDKAAAGYTLVATSSGLTSAASGTFTITAATAATFAITSLPVTGAAATTATLGPITVREQDQFGDPVAAPAGGTVVTLASNSAGTKVFATTSGGTAVTSVTIAAGSSGATFYYGDTKAATPTITVSGSLTSASQVQTIIAAAPASLCITINPACTGGGMILIPKGTGSASTVSLRDAFGNAAIAISPVTVSASLNGSGSVSGSPVLIPAGQSTSNSAFTYTAANGKGQTGTVSVAAGVLTPAAISFKSN
ncbi:MAG: hypothetical protein ACRDWT_18535 [Jatrophihabitantaceae bacterium]